MTKTCDEAYRDRITSNVENDRNCLRGRFGRKHRRGRIRYRDHRDLTPNQIAQDFRKQIIAPLQPTVFNRYILPFAKASFGKASAEFGENFDRVPWRPCTQISDHRHRWLLRARHQRPRGRATKQRYELAAFQSIDLHPVPLTRVTA